MGFLFLIVFQLHCSRPHTIQISRIHSKKYLFEGLEQVAARHRQGDVYVVHDEERLLLALVWEIGEVVCYKQQHVHFGFLQREITKQS